MFAVSDDRCSAEQVHVGFFESTDRIGRHRYRDRSDHHHYVEREQLHQVVHDIPDLGDHKAEGITYPAGFSVLKHVQYIQNLRWRGSGQAQRSGYLGSQDKFVGVQHQLAYAFPQIQARARTSVHASLMTCDPCMDYARLVSGWSRSAWGMGDILKQVVSLP